MRAIEFRAKSINGGPWVYGGGVWTFGDKTVLFGPDNKGRPLITIVEPETVGQFTGLHDKNGKKIWEGDVVRFYLGRDYVGIVEWCDDETAFLIMPYFRNITPRLNIEVIGNIYEHPELVTELRKVEEK